MTEEDSMYVRYCKWQDEGRQLYRTLNPCQQHTIKESDYIDAHVRSRWLASIEQKIRQEVRNG